MHNRLMAFYRANKGKGAPLAVSNMGGAVTIEVYDFIVSSDDDAAWLGGVSAQSVIRAIRGAGTSDIALRINSPGGDVFAGVAMAQAIREHEGNVTAHVDGYAASAASLLVAAADKAIIAPAGMVMIHKAWTLAVGNADDMMATAKLLEKIDGQLVNAYREKAGDKRDWAALMTAETWFTADDAVAAGLVDAVAEKSDKKPKMAFDLSAFANVPAAAIADDEGESRVVELNVEPSPAFQDAIRASVAAVAATDIEHERRRAMARLALVSPVASQAALRSPRPAV